MASLGEPGVGFLLAACSVADAPHTPEAPPDWGRLARLAWLHRVSPLVYEHRERLALPPAAVEPFRKAAMATLHRNLQLAAELKLALRALSAADIPVILLKGAHLMDAVYQNPALRPMSDLDILVRPEHAVRAVAALAGEGYRADARKAAFTRRADREIRLSKSGVHELVIELHTSLNRPTRHHWFPMDALWERSTPYTVDGERAGALAWEDNAVFLCAHALPHAFAQLIWLRDIAGLMAQGLDGDTLRRAARAAHAERAVETGLALAHSLMDAPLPEGFDAAAAHRRAPRHFAGSHYSTLASLRLRAALSDSPADAASILAAALTRKFTEIVTGRLTRKAKTKGGV